MSLPIQLTDEQRKILREFQLSTKYTKAYIYIRITVILDLDKAISIADISNALGIDISSIYRYIKIFKNEGIDALVDESYKGYKGKLSNEQLNNIKQHLSSHCYQDSKSIIEYIYNCTGITYSHSGIVVLLHKLGFVYKKTKQIPSKANKQLQEEFIQTFKQLNKHSLKKDNAIYFIDGVHPTHNTRSYYGWILKGKEYTIKTNSGRDRVNINGALNINCITDIQYVQSDSINAQSTIELYTKLINNNLDKDIIYVITDNAKYYKSKVLNEWLKHTNIKQVFLPPYSPNLNIIERLWKFLRKKVINPHFYENKQKFRQAIHNFFNNIHLYEQELQTLLTPNFRVVDS